MELPQSYYIIVFVSGSNHRYAVIELHKTPDVLRGPGDLSYTLSPSSFIISGNRSILFSHEAQMLTNLFHSLKKGQQVCKKTVGKQASINTRERLFTHRMWEKESLTYHSIVRLS